MRDDGGPAFPGNVAECPVCNVRQKTPEGMSLRDWFAGQLLANANVSDDDACIAVVACVAYKVADAMLKAREEGQP